VVKGNLRYLKQESWK